MSGTHFWYKIEKSALVTFIGIVFLFSFAVAITLFAPSHVDSSWTTPSSTYQVQMYEISDPHFYLSSAGGVGKQLEFVYHLKDKFSLLAFQESPLQRIIAPPDLEQYITKLGSETLILTSRLLLLRKPESNENTVQLQKTLKEEWEKANPDWKKKNQSIPRFEVLELYDPKKGEAFAAAPTDGILESWAEKNFKILDPSEDHPYHAHQGVIYVLNPHEYRVTRYNFGDESRWRVDPNGEPIASLEELQNPPFGFRSRQQLIHDGEHQFAIEGCWYCHTDQTRTLVQDVVLNGADSYPAPPSAANEYIYQKITFPGTRRIGPDLSRVGIKRPYRDWHISHFWSPKSESKGSIMPSFKHFFDFDPRGAPKRTSGIPNYRFEAIYQYLMTKGTRITPPTEAWWLGKDPIQTKEIIEGKKVLKSGLYLHPAVIDAIGFYGSMLTYAQVFFFAGSALVIVLYLWKKGQLDMDQSPAIKMLEEKEDES